MERLLRQLRPDREDPAGPRRVWPADRARALLGHRLRGAAAGHARERAAPLPALLPDARRDEPVAGRVRGRDSDLERARPCAPDAEARPRHERCGRADQRPRRRAERPRLARPDASRATWTTGFRSRSSRSTLRPTTNSSLHARLRTAAGRSRRSARRATCSRDTARARHSRPHSSSARSRWRCCSPRTSSRSGGFAGEARDRPPVDPARGRGALPRARGGRRARRAGRRSVGDRPSARATSPQPSPSVPSWTPDQLAPFGLARRLLAVDDDLAFRRAVLAFHRARTGIPSFDNGLEGTALRVEAEAALARSIRSDTNARRASAAANLLGVLSVIDATSPAGARRRSSAASSSSKTRFTSTRTTSRRRPTSS